MLKNNGSYERDVQRRCAKTTSAFNSFTKCLWSTPITNEVKLRVYLSAIRPIMMYGSETWTAPSTVMERRPADRLVQRVLKSSSGLSWKKTPGRKRKFWTEVVKEDLRTLGVDRQFRRDVRLRRTWNSDDWIDSVQALAEDREGWAELCSRTAHLGEDEVFKGEWLTVKDNFLYCGSIGKEKTTDIGEFLDDNPMFVKKISAEGIVQTENWVKYYIALRSAIDIHFPGYVIHEAVQWSDVHKKWFFLPRHLSKLAYNNYSTEETGANVLLAASEEFDDISAIAIGREIVTRGFSAFQFVPRTNDTIIVALKTEELHGKPFASFVMVFTINGDIILDETRIPGDIKYEGLEFLYEQNFKSLTA
ncbi:hypothetical protein RB195_025615 [Necator americanus]|uniref:START domain-containing protein n=1 Tax=Necator americanus TaxID=51031 RepID=A0ABR1ET37_NECAM